MFTGKGRVAEVMACFSILTYLCARTAALFDEPWLQSQTGGDLGV